MRREQYRLQSRRCSRSWLRRLVLLGCALVAEAGSAREVWIDSDASLADALRGVTAWRAEGAAVELILAPGEYRTPLRLVGSALPVSDDSPRLLTIRASDPGRVVFTEAIRLETWEQESFRVWQHELPETALTGRLFYDGAWLRRATNRERMNPWEYLVEPGTARVQIAIPSGVAVDFSAFRWATGRSGGLLLLQQVENVKLQGLTFAYDFTAGGVALFDGPHLVSTRQVEIENCRFLWNQHGLRVLDGENLRILNSQFQHNGEQGLSLSQVGNVELRGVVVSHNGRTEPTAEPGLPFGHALLIEEMRGPVNVTHSQIHDNTAGFLVRNGHGHPMNLQHLVIGHHQGAGLAFYGNAPQVNGRELRLGRNGGPAIDLQAHDPVGARALALSEAILFSVDGGSVIRVGSGTLALRRSIVESRAKDGWLIRLDGVGVAIGQENLYYHRDGPENVFNGESYRRWMLDPDRDQGSRFEDPLFLNTETLDFDMDFSSPWFRR